MFTFTLRTLASERAIKFLRPTVISESRYCTLNRIISVTVEFAEKGLDEGRPAVESKYNGAVEVSGKLSVASSDCVGEDSPLVEIDTGRSAVETNICDDVVVEVPVVRPESAGVGTGSVDVKAGIAMEVPCEVCANET